MVSFQGGPGFWVPGELNPVDWCTKTRKAEELMSYFWLRGPDFLLLDISEWPIKFTYKKEELEGELPIPKPVFLVCKVSESLIACWTGMIPGRRLMVLISKNLVFI